MKLGKIALKIRLANTDFGSNVAGAAELDLALKNTLLVESAFVIPLDDNVSENKEENTVNQTITERFGVVCGIKCDTNQSDKTGLKAYDRLHDIRGQLFRAILGWQLKEAESIISYAGGSTQGIDGAWLWYQFNFQYTSRVHSYGTLFRYCDIEENNTNENENWEVGSFEKLYANFILADDERLPYTGSLPVPDGYPDVLIPNIALMIDFTEEE